MREYTAIEKLIDEVVQYGSEIVYTADILNKWQNAVGKLLDDMSRRREDEAEKMLQILCPMGDKSNCVNDEFEKPQSIALDRFLQEINITGGC